MKKQILLLSFSIFLSASSALFGQISPNGIKNVKVYFEKGMFGGWPANFGIWNWGDEILVGFAKGYYKDLGPERHNIDREKPELHLLARSLDGGETWKIEDPCKSGKGSLFVPNHGSYHGIERTDVKPEKLVNCKGINFQNPNLAFTLRMTNTDGGNRVSGTPITGGTPGSAPLNFPILILLGLRPELITLSMVKKSVPCLLLLQNQTGKRVV